jgi:predicted PurR-regulated permease PerM
MSESNNLDQARADALKRIEQAERNYTVGIILVVIFEAVFGMAFLLLMDFRDRLHWLLLLAAVLVYGVVLLSVVNVGKYITSATHTILQAIFAQQRDASDAGRS